MAEISLREKYAGAARHALDDEGADAGGDLRAKYDTETRHEFEPGEDWTNPLDEQHPEVNRFRLKTWADAGPKTMQANLEAAGFEARQYDPENAMRFAIRKRDAGEPWRVLDPRRFGVVETAKDIWDPIPSMAALLPGYLWAGAKGAGLGARVAGPLGAIPGGIAGAAGGSGAAEAGKQAIASGLGYEIDPEERAGKIATEAVVGGAGRALEPVAGLILDPLVQGIGKGLKGAGKGLRSLAESPLGRRVLGKGRGPAETLEATQARQEGLRRLMEEAGMTPPPPAPESEAARAARQEGLRDLMEYSRAERALEARTVEPTPGTLTPGSRRGEELSGFSEPPPSRQTPTLPRQTPSEPAVYQTESGGWHLEFPDGRKEWFATEDEAIDALWRARGVKAVKPGTAPLDRERPAPEGRPAPGEEPLYLPEDIEGKDPDLWAWALENAEELGPELWKRGETQEEVAERLYRGIRDDPKAYQEFTEGRAFRQIEGVPEDPGGEFWGPPEDLPPGMPPGTPPEPPAKPPRAPRKPPEPEPEVTPGYHWSRWMARRPRKLYRPGLPPAPEESFAARVAREATGRRRWEGTAGVSRQELERRIQENLGSVTPEDLVQLRSVIDRELLEAVPPSAMERYAALLKSGVAPEDARRFAMEGVQAPRPRGELPAEARLRPGELTGRQVGPQARTDPRFRPAHPPPLRGFRKGPPLIYGGVGEPPMPKVTRRFYDDDTHHLTIGDEFIGFFSHQELRFSAAVVDTVETAIKERRPLTAEQVQHLQEIYRRVGYQDSEAQKFIERIGRQLESLQKAPVSKPPVPAPVPGIRPPTPEAARMSQEFPGVPLELESAARHSYDQDIADGIPEQVARDRAILRWARQAPEEPAPRPGAPQAAAKPPPPAAPPRAAGARSTIRLERDDQHSELWINDERVLYMGGMHEQMMREISDVLKPRILAGARELDDESADLIREKFMEHFYPSETGIDAIEGYIRQIRQAMFIGRAQVTSEPNGRHILWLGDHRMGDWDNAGDARKVARVLNDALKRGQITENQKQQIADVMFRSAEFDDLLERFSEFVPDAPSVGTATDRYGDIALRFGDDEVASFDPKHRSTLVSIENRMDEVIDEGDLSERAWKDIRRLLIDADMDPDDATDLLWQLEEMLIPPRPPRPSVLPFPDVGGGGPGPSLASGEMSGRGPTPGGGMPFDEPPLYGPAAAPQAPPGGAAPPGPPRTPPAAPGAVPALPRGQLRAWAGVLRELGGGAVRAVGGALELPSRAAKRGIEALLERFPRGYGARAKLGEDREAIREWLREAADQGLVLPHLSQDPTTRRTLQEAADALRRPFVRTEEIRRYGESIAAAFGRIDPELEKRMLADLSERLPKLPESTRFLGVSPTAAPEAELVSGALGGPTTPGAIGGTIAGLGLAGKAVRTLGLKIMRDPSGAELRRLMGIAPPEIQKKIMPLLGKLQSPTALRAGIWVLLHDPLFRAFLEQESQALAPSA